MFSEKSDEYQIIVNREILFESHVYQDALKVFKDQLNSAQLTNRKVSFLKNGKLLCGHINMPTLAEQTIPNERDTTAEVALDKLVQCVDTAFETDLITSDEHDQITALIMPLHDMHQYICPNVHCGAITFIYSKCPTVFCPNCGGRYVEWF